MAGQVRERRRWQLQDGPHGTLRRLRSQLAEDGCVDSQLSLAKSLLEEAGQECDKKKEEMAVGWLLKAAQQDCSQAKQLLKQCVEQKRGLQEGNVEKISEILSQNPVETQMRNAARDLYAELSLDGTPLTAQMLLQKTGSPSDDSLQVVDNKGVVYTEEDLLNLASQLATGQRVQSAIDWEERCRRYCNLSWKEKLMEPWASYVTKYAQTIESLASLGPRLISALSPFNLLLLTIVWFGCIDSDLSFTFHLIFYASSLMMLVSTLEMLHLQRLLQSIRCWLMILNVEAVKVQCEGLFLWNDGGVPYWRFFKAGAGLILTYPLVVDQWLPSAGLAIIASVFALSTFVAIGVKNCWLVVLSISLHLFGHLLPQFGLSFPLAPGISLRLCLPTLLSLIVPGLFLAIAIRNNFCGIHRVLFPHLVCVFWSQLAVELWQNANPQSLITTAFFVGLLVLVLPLLSSLTMATGIIGVLCIFYFSPAWIIAVVILLVLPYLLQTCKLTPQYDVVVAWIRCIFYAMLAFLTFVCIPYPAHPIPSETLDWTDYHRLCHQPSWASSTPCSVARVQYDCRHLAGVRVNWVGTVHRVTISSTTNKVEFALSWIPEPIQRYMRCMWGAGYLDQCSDDRIGEAFDVDMGRVVCRLRLQECHLTTWDVHTFEIVISLPAVPDTADVFVNADHHFASFLLGLRRSDVVEVSGTLSKDIGGPLPNVKLTGISCISCVNDLEPLTTPENLGPFSQSLQFAVSFFLSPFVKFVG